MTLQCLSPISQLSDLSNMKSIFPLLELCALSLSAFWLPPVIIIHSVFCRRATSETDAKTKRFEMTELGGHLRFNISKNGSDFHLKCVFRCSRRPQDMFDLCEEWQRIKMRTLKKAIQKRANTTKLHLEISHSSSFTDSNAMFQISIADHFSNYIIYLICIHRTIKSWIPNASENIFCT